MIFLDRVFHGPCYHGRSGSLGKVTQKLKIQVNKNYKFWTTIQLSRLQNYIFSWASSPI